MVNFMYNGVFHPHPALRLHRLASLPFFEEDLKVVLQVLFNARVSFLVTSKTLVVHGLNKVA